MVSGAQFVILRFQVLITVGDPYLRTYTPTSAQKAVTFLCLDSNGKSATYNSVPPTLCPSGIRA